MEDLQKLDLGICKVLRSFPMCVVIC